MTEGRRTPERETNERQEDPARALWQSQTTRRRHFTSQEIQNMSQQLHRKIRARNTIECVAAVILTSYSGWRAWIAESGFERAGHVLLALGALYVVQRLLTLGSARRPHPEALAQNALDFHRQELERQYTLLRNVWRWYLGPLVPGLVVLMGAHAVRAAQQGPHGAWPVAIASVISALVFVGIARLNQRAAKQLRREIDELDAVRGSRGAISVR